MSEPADIVSPQARHHAAAWVFLTPFIALLFVMFAIPGYVAAWHQHITGKAWMDDRWTRILLTLPVFLGDKFPALGEFYERQYERSRGSVLVRSKRSATPVPAATP